MAVKVSCVKKSAMKMKFGAKMKLGDPILEFQFVDNEDTTCTVNGVSSAGNPVDISDVATLVVSSADPTKVSVDAPVGMTFAMHAVGPLVPEPGVNIEVVAVWNDGSLGPFNFTLPVTVVAGPAAGIQVVVGTPTTH